MSISSSMGKQVLYRRIKDEDRPIMLQSADMPGFLAARRKLLEPIDRGTPDEALTAWRTGEEDWAILLAFARRKDLPKYVYEMISMRGSWLLQVALSWNPSVPEEFLQHWAKLPKDDGRIPSLHDDLDERDDAGKSLYDATQLHFIARAALRRRIAHQ